MSSAKLGTAILCAVAVVAASGAHSAQIVAQGRRAMMEGKRCQAKEMAGAVCTVRTPRHSSFPPLMSLSGQSASQETKCPAVGHFDMSRPTSLNSGKTFSSNPGICVTSTPNSL